jgi:hypothetical protein
MEASADRGTYEQREIGAKGSISREKKEHREHEQR